MRHTAYNNYAAQARIGMFGTAGITLQSFERLNIGPILFREETKFFKEIRLAENFSVDLELLAARNDASKWSIHHSVRVGESISATITVDGAWLDLKKRRVITPPEEIRSMMSQIVKHESFQVIPDKVV